MEIIIYLHINIILKYILEFFKIVNLKTRKEVIHSSVLVIQKNIVLIQDF